MNTVKILYEQYKALPKGIQKELKTLINSEDEETVEVSVTAIKRGLKELKLVRQGKLQARPISELFKELRNE